MNDTVIAGTEQKDNQPVAPEQVALAPIVCPPESKPVITTATGKSEAENDKQPAKLLNNYVPVPLAEKITILVYGGSGAGKSTFCQNLLNISSLDRIEKTQKLTKHKKTVRALGANGQLVEVHITIIDTVGSGDDLYFQTSAIPIVDEMKKRLKKKKKHKSVSWLFYFLSNHRMTENDIRVIRMFAKYTNVILLMGKADTYTRSELLEMQAKVREQVTANSIDLLFLHDEDGAKKHTIFDFPYPIIGHERKYKSDPLLSSEERENEPRDDITTDNEQVCVNNLIRSALFENPTSKGRPGYAKIKQIRRRFTGWSVINPWAYSPEVEFYWWKYQILIETIACILASFMLLPILLRLM